MKTKILLLAAAVPTGALFVPAVQAQTTSVPAALITLTETNSSGGVTAASVPQSFLSTLAQWSTSENTNYTWISNRLEIATGEKTYNTVNVSSFLDMNVNLNDAWSVVSEVDNAGAGGIIQTLSLGAGYAVINQNDLKVNVELIGGYYFSGATGEFELRVMARKKLTTNTYVEAGIGLPEELKGPINEDPSVYVGVGLTFH